jgi:prepilin-type N-terminal cleavage/methylation domain-containing protein
LEEGLHVCHITYEELTGSKKSRCDEGFTLVELIIVIAIMAILASAIGLGVIKYLEKSRESNCINTRKTMENEYLLEKAEIEEKRNNSGEYTEYTVDEYLKAHDGEYSCDAHGTFSQHADGSIGCSVHGSIYDN